MLRWKSDMVKLELLELVAERLAKRDFDRQLEPQLAAPMSSAN